MARFDSKVETTWKKNWKWVDAVSFLESGGRYAETGDGKKESIDRDYVLPMLKRLAAKHDLRWQAVVDPKRSRLAVALVTELPLRDGILGAIEDSLAEEEKTFPGAILLQPGHRWLTVEFLDERQAKVLKAAEERAER